MKTRLPDPKDPSQGCVICDECRGRMLRDVDSSQFKEDDADPGMGPPQQTQLVPPEEEWDEEWMSASSPPATQPNSDDEKSCPATPKTTLEK